MPIQQYAPQDCTASINAIVEKIDYVFSTGNPALIAKMKSIFGMEGMADPDFAQAIAYPSEYRACTCLRRRRYTNNFVVGGPFYYPTCTWQELNWDPEENCPDFFYFCGNVTNADAPESITSVDYALANATNGEPWINLGNYANYIKKYVNPICTGYPLYHTPFDGDYCFGTQNQTYWADVRNSAKRSYLYTTCTENGFYQTAPKSGPSLISNVLDVAYTQYVKVLMVVRCAIVVPCFEPLLIHDIRIHRQWCTWAFPPG